MRYFNKNFFKFTLGFLLILLFSILFMAAVSANAFGLEKIVFTNEERLVSPGEISESLTIQTRDGADNPIQTPETLDLEFFSSSATGQFLSASGNSVTKTMSKNTSNRTFYYRDSVEGDFVITVKAIGRESLETWQVSQKIKVSKTGQTKVLSGEVLSSNTDTQETDLSATTGAVSPAYAIAKNNLEVSLGGDRLSAVGSPLTFQASIRKNTSADSSVIFNWSFGDGKVGSGPLVNHTYKYPGEYALVLNARSGNNFAIARAKVLVVEPELSLFDQGDFVTIKNNSKQEVNLFNWKITKADQSFIFQPDTIVLPGREIVIEESDFKLKDSFEDGLVLRNSLGKVMTVAPISLKEQEVSKYQDELDNIQKQVFKITNQAIDQKLVLEKTNPRDYPKSFEVKEKEQNLLDNNQTPEVDLNLENNSNQNILFESPKDQGLILKLTNFVKRLFYK